jgi:hypothetical protein
LRFFEDITVSFSVKKCSKSKKENVKQSEYWKTHKIAICI